MQQSDRQLAHQKLLDMMTSTHANYFETGETLRTCFFDL